MTIAQVSHSNGRRWGSVWFCIPPVVLLCLFASLLLWKPQLTHSAASHLPNLPGLLNLGSKKNSTYSEWDRKGRKAETFMSDATATQWGSEEASQWWVEYSKVIMDGAPNFQDIRFADNAGSRPVTTYASIEIWASREQRLNMTTGELNEMTNKHKQTLERLNNLAPRMPFIPGTRGIVVTTAVDAMAFLTVSLRMLRRTGTTLPVEIWMFDRSQWMVDPWGLRMCREVWLHLDATCRFVSDHLPSDRPPPYNKPTEKYMNKLDAMMFSSFEQILFMDSDNNAIMPLDSLFEREPFKSHGMVLWPDYWKNWASPYFFQISTTPVPSVFNKSSTESGQIMINKHTHATALLLASYYGRYQQHYIRLLEQDPGSEGDKETFLHAASASNLSVYQIVEPPDHIGYRCNNDQRAVASGQHHTEDDYYLTKLGLQRGYHHDLLNDGTKPRILFIHGNLPKYDPAAYLRWHTDSNWADQLRCDRGKGKAHRMWGDQSLTILKHGWDVEKALWDQMLWTSCETEYLQTQWWTPTWWHNWTKIEHVCEDFGALYDELLGAKGEGLVYSPALGPAPFEKDGEAMVRARQHVALLAWDEVLGQWREGT